MCSIFIVVGEMMAHAIKYTENFKNRTGNSVGVSFAPDWGEGNVLGLCTGVDTIIEPAWSSTCHRHCVSMGNSPSV